MHENIKSQSNIKNNVYNQVSNFIKICDKNFFIGVQIRKKVIVITFFQPVINFWL